jgi:hypothetical protein
VYWLIVHNRLALQEQKYDYRVVSKTTIRASCDPKSAKMGKAEAGTLIAVLEQRRVGVGTRSEQLWVRFDRGWISTITKDGSPVLGVRTLLATKRSDTTHARTHIYFPAHAASANILHSCLAIETGVHPRTPGTQGAC